MGYGFIEIPASEKWWNPRKAAMRQMHGKNVFEIGPDFSIFSVINDFIADTGFLI